MDFIYGKKHKENCRKAISQHPGLGTSLSNLAGGHCAPPDAACISCGGDFALAPRPHPEVHDGPLPSNFPLNTYISGCRYIAYILTDDAPHGWIHPLNSSA